MKYLYSIVLIFVVISSCSKDELQSEKDGVDPIANDPIINDTIIIDTTVIEIDVISDLEFASKNFGNTKSSNFIGNLTDIEAQPLEGVKITIGNQTVFTDANGVFVLNDVTVNEKFTFIKAEKEEYILGSRSVVPAANGSNFITITLLKKNSIQTVNSGETSEVSLPNGAKVNFGGSFVNANGALYSGKVEVSMHYLEPNQPETFSQMPGSLFGKRENNEATAMETYGMLAVNLYSPAGEILNISEDTPAKIHFPVSATTPNAPSTMPLWYFDEAVGYWKEQGFATKVGGDYVADVSHFTWWNCDLPLSTVNACFELKNEAALSNTYFEIRRTINNQLIYSGNTNEKGLNCGLFPKDEILSIDLFSDCDAINPAGSKEIGPYSEDNSSVIVNIDELTDLAITTISATVTNCNNTPVANGYAFLHSTNTNKDFKLLHIINGEIVEQFVYCKEVEYRIVVIDIDTNEVSDEMVISSIENGITDLGQLQTCPSQGGGVFEGSISFTTQEEVDAFGLIGYSEITGDLTIDGQQSINSLANLSNLTTIGGHFYLKTGAQSLNGLENLRTIGGNFDIMTNIYLTSLIALENLTSIGGRIWLLINHELTSLSGLESLNSVGSISISSNRNLSTLTGLEGITSINEHISVIDNNSLTNLQGLNNITSVGIDVTIQENDNLLNLSGLDNISSISRNLKINGNNNLTALTGLENLTGVGQVFIGNSSRPNPNLANFCALTNLFQIGNSFGQVSIKENAYNPSFQDIHNGDCKITGQSGGVYEGSITLTTQAEVDNFGLLGHSEITGDLIIEADASLDITSLANLQNLTKIGGSLSIEETELTNLNGLDNLTFIGNRFTINKNSNLTVLSGLDNLNTIAGQYVRITDNGQLTSLSGLEKITAINGELYISHNHSLTSLVGLENITSIELALIIHQNHGLTSLQGLDSLTSIGQGIRLSGSIYTKVGLQISTNLELISIMGLANVSSLKGDLIISNNKKLPNLQGLENITAINGHLEIRKNAILNSLKGLNNLTSILYNLTTSSSYDIDTLSDLESLTSIGNDLLLQETGITTLNGLENLNSVGGKIVIGNLYDEAFNVINGPNYSLSNFCALSNLMINGSYNEVIIEGNAYNPSTSDIYYGNCAD